MEEPDPAETLSLDVSLDRRPTMEMAPARHEASLVVLTGEAAGRSFALDDADALVGRGDECLIQLLDSDVSREHARVRREGDRFIIDDLKSRNGIGVNGIPVETHVLTFGDRISVGGSTLLLFTHYDDLEEQLMHQQKMESLGRLAGGIAHDFNNLLGAVVANLGFLGGFAEPRRTDDLEVTAALGDISAAIAQASELTSRLLSFARRADYEERPVNVSMLTKEAISLVERTFGPDYVIDARVAPDLMVVGDRSQLHQVIMNLLINARDSMPGGGRLNVDVRLLLEDQQPRKTGLKKPVAAVSISDTGSGMTDEVKKRIFEPFFSTKLTGHGTGLGLAMVYGIVENHRGEITVRTTPGEGSTFSVFFPTVHVIADRPTPPKGGSLDTKGGTILIVDDEELYLRGAERLVSQSGYNVLLAKSAPEALQLVRQHPKRIKLVLLDLMMPTHDGVVACRQLLALEPELRILAMSGLGEHQQTAEVIQAGARGLLRKPFDAKTFRKAVQEVFLHGRWTGE